MKKSDQRNDRLHWLLRAWAFLQSFVIVALAAGGLFATATALDRSEAWAYGVTVFLFLLAWIVVFQRLLEG